MMHYGIAFLSLVALSNVAPAQSKIAATGPVGFRPVTRAPDEIWIASWSSSDVVRCNLTTGQCEDVVTDGLGGLSLAHHFSFGPAGDLYVASWGTSSVLRYDGGTYAFKSTFVPPGTGGLQNTHTAVWGQDGNLYCAGEFTDGVVRFAPDGSLIDQFITPGSGGLDGPEFLRYGPDGLMYVADHQGSSVRRYDPETGAFIDVFVQSGAGGLNRAHFLTWGPDKNLYVTSSNSNEVLRFDGKTGAFIDTFVPAGSGGLSFPAGLTFSPDGSVLYVASFNNSRILRYDGTTGAFLGIAFLGVSGGFQGPLFISYVPEPELNLQAPLPGLAGTTNALGAFRATPGELVAFYFAPAAGDFTPIAGCTQFLNLVPPFLLAGAKTADASGHVEVNTIVPASLSGQPLFFQAIELDNCRPSNLLRHTFP